LVFPNTVDRAILPQNLLQRSLYPLLERAGLPRLRFHDLRHSAATLLLARGVHPKVVSELLGHTQIGITLDLYSHVSATMLRTRRTLPTSCPAFRLAARRARWRMKPQVSPRSSGDRATVS
jgi:site-specific recombinase XerD